MSACVWVFSEGCCFRLPKIGGLELGAGPCFFDSKKSLVCRTSPFCFHLISVRSAFVRRSIPGSCLQSENWCCDHCPVGT